MDVQNTPTLETERLVLRKFTDDDIEAIFEIYGDEEVNTYLPWFALKSLDEAKGFYDEKYAAVYQQPRAYRYAVCLKTDNLPIGYVHVSMEDSHDLGYALRREFWHKGIATEAGKAVLEQVGKDGLTHVTATHDVKNPRSGEVMKRLGMRHQYTYEERWQPKNMLVSFRMYQLNLDGRDDRVYKGYWDRYPVHYIEKDLSVPFLRESRTPATH